MSTFTQPPVATRTRSHPLVESPGRRLVSTEPDRTAALLRVTLGTVLFPHGAQHFLGWFDGYGFSGTLQWMTGDLGFPAPLVALAILTEFFGSLALVVGWYGRLAALGMVGLMLGALSTHTANGFFMNWFGALPAGAEGFEYHLLVIAMALAVVSKGSGAWSLDRLTSSRAGHRHRVALGVLASLALVACESDAVRPAVEVAEVRVRPAEGLWTGIMNVGDVLPLAATPLAADGSELPELPVVWKSSDTGVVEVSGGGLLRAHGEGWAEVSAAVGEVVGRLGVSVIVEPSPVMLVHVMPQESVLTVGSSRVLSIRALDANYDDVTWLPVSWSVSPAGLVWVSPAGVAYGLAAGYAEVTATVGRVRGGAGITVVEP